jgi:threonine dehydrogenase-like Zn-dependent dehydrogenase
MSGAGMMRAVQIDAPAAISLVERPKPEPLAGEVRLALTHVGYCGSDLSSFEGRNPMVSFPRVPGHEIAAVVDALGEGVEGLSAGQPCTVLPYFNCGTCIACRKGRPNACRNNQTMGVQREGAMASYACVPAAHVIPVDGFAQRDLALIEPIAVGFHAVDRSGLDADDTVAVLGVGMIGLGVLLGAVARGARVIAVDVAESKLDLARRLGATETVNGAAEDTVERLADLTGGDGPTVIIEAAGAAATFRQAVDAVSSCGRVVYVGYTKTEVSYETRLFPMKEIEIFGSRGATRDDFRHVVDFLRARPGIGDLIVSSTPGIAEATEAMVAWAADPGSVTKIIVDMDTTATGAA